MSELKEGRIYSFNLAEQKPEVQAQVLAAVMAYLDIAVDFRPDPHSVGDTIVYIARKLT